MAGRRTAEAKAPKGGKTGTAKAGKPEAKKAEPAGKAGKPEQAKRRHRQLTEAEWRKIRIEYAKGKTTCKKLAEKYGISESAIWKKSTKEGWKKRRKEVSRNIAEKTLLRVCDARAEEFAVIARANDRLGEALDNLMSFVLQQPPESYEDMRGVESLAKAIAQVVKTKRDLYNMPGSAEKAQIEALRAKVKDQEKAAGTVWRIERDDTEEEPMDE